jgi:hypothetical protein
MAAELWVGRSGHSPYVILPWAAVAATTSLFSLLLPLVGVAVVPVVGQLLDRTRLATIYAIVNGLGLVFAVLLYVSPPCAKTHPRLGTWPLRAACREDQALPVSVYVFLGARALACIHSPTHSLARAQADSGDGGHVRRDCMHGRPPPALLLGRQRLHCPSVRPSSPLTRPTNGAATSLPHHER